MEIDHGAPVLVTGGTGYLASWIVKKLLDKGITVHATSRNIHKENKVAYLKSFAKRDNSSLKLFEADLMEEGAFDKAMQGCQLVMHVASPYIVQGITDPVGQLIKPAIEGTRNVLSSANRTKSVKRVVLTSSTAAIFGDASDISDTENGIFDESIWNETSHEEHQPYYYSKTMAEKEAWKMSQQQDRWELVVLNPGFILGPSASERQDGTSVSFMVQMARGEFKMGVPALYFGMVDVRDIADAHIKAGYIPDASGRNIIIAENKSFLDIARVVKNKYGNRFKIASKFAPKWLMWLLAPTLGVTRKFVSKNVAIPVKFDNSKSIKSLKMQYLSFEKTIEDHFAQLIDDGIIN